MVDRPDGALILITYRAQCLSRTEGEDTLGVVELQVGRDAIVRIRLLPVLPRA